VRKPNYQLEKRKRDLKKQKKKEDKLKRRQERQEAGLEPAEGAGSDDENGSDGEEE
jgi:hypothetical protein